MSLFKVIERIEWLVYRLKLPPHWWIHNIISIAHLEKATTADSYNQLKSDHLSAVTVNSDLNHYKIEKLLCKRTRHSEHRDCEIITEYLIQWKGYSSEHNVWYNIKDLSNSRELTKAYNDAHTEAQIKALTANTDTEAEAETLTVTSWHLQGEISRSFSEAFWKHLSPQLLCVLSLPLISSSIHVM